MTSFNHYALGSVAHFLHSVIGGLSPASPGWKETLIRPQPGGTITSAKTHTITPYGIVSCEWEVDKGKVKVKVEVPPNTTAKVILPGPHGETETVGSGMYEFNATFEQDKRWPPRKYGGKEFESGVQPDTFIP